MLSILRNSALSVLLGATLAGGSISAFAQSQSINGSIRGRAADSTGASIPGAIVTIVNGDVGFSKTVTTGDDGLFVLLNLPLGTYKVSVTKTGFSSVDYQQIVLNAGKELTLDPILKVGADSTEIEVTAETAGIDPSTLNLQRTLDSREVQNLPLTSRNPYNFILFQPGVSGHPNPELGIPRTINTNGLLDRINYQMDGMVNTESDRIGLRLFPIGNIFVKEVQTVSNSFAPEFGWTSGNVYNVISNNGSNSLHGLFQYVQRWQDATAYPFFSNKALPKNNLELEDYSANLGGRIIKDKLFFFGSYEKLTRGSPNPTTITAANATALGLTAQDVAATPGLLNAKFVDGRVDLNINKKNSMFVRYNYFKNTFPFNTQVGGLNTQSTAVDFADRAHVIATQLITTISDNLLNELRFSWPFRSNAHFAGPSGGTGPAIVVTAAAALGGSSNGGDQYNDKVPSGSENVSYVRGKHTLKVGFNLSELINRQRLVSFNRYTFASSTYSATASGPAVPKSAIGNYLAAKNGSDPYAYSLYESQQDKLGLGYASLFYGGYVQDTWQISPRLLAIYGGRYDRFQSPNANPNALYPDSRSFNVPKTNFAPRVGLSYRVHEKTVVKASVGMFYQATPTNLWFNALNQDGSNRTSNFSYGVTKSATGLRVVPAGAPAFPTVPTSVGGVIPTQNVTTISPHFRNEYTWNATAQISQELARHDTLTIGYIMANGRNLEYAHNINLIPTGATLADGRPIFGSGRVDTRFNNVTRVESGANSSFNALIVNYTHALVRGVQLNANYTWSHTLSNAPEVNTFEVAPGVSSIEDATNLRRDRGNASVNRPNAFNMTAVIEPTLHLQNSFLNGFVNHNMLALLGNLSSGDQSSIVTGSSLNGDSTVSLVARPAFVARNTIRSPSVYQVDGRLTRTLPKFKDRLALSAFIEGNNLFNHTNVTVLSVTQSVNPDGTATAAAPSVVRGTVLEARIVQWGVAARF